MDNDVLGLLCDPLTISDASPETHKRCPEDSLLNLGYHKRVKLSEDEAPAHNDTDGMVIGTPSDSSLFGVQSHCPPSSPDKTVFVPLKPLPAMPLVWAQSRQEVCESFDWFRSYQGGVYFVKDVVKGYLLSGFPAKRDGFFQGGKLIISHGGGKAESLQQSKGQTRIKPADDQRAEDKSVRALLNNYRRGVPLALLIDDRYAQFPFDLAAKNITYAVLGFFLITHAWAEREITRSGQQHVRFKFSFQWCEEQGQPWWHATPNDDKVDWSPNPLALASLQSTDLNDSLENDNARTLESNYEDLDIDSDNKALPTADSASTVSNSECSARRRIPTKKSEFLLSERRPGLKGRTCVACYSASPLVFKDGWGCLNSTCSRFWTLPEKGFLSFSPELEYDDNFLELQPLPPLDQGHRDIRPPQPITNPADKITTVQSFTRGMHCTKCGRLTSRFKWQHWECANCQSVLPIAVSIRRASDLKNLRMDVSFDYNFLGQGTGIIRLPLEFFEDEESKGHIQTFLLPDGKGRIHHIQHNSRGPQKRMDDLFEEYQQEASDGTLPFTRWPLRSHKLRGALLTNYFSQNCGEPYHYVGGTANTLSWDEAPSAVVKAKSFIEERTRLALEKHFQFNEVLSAAYMDRQKMSFHTDDEKGLGEVVAGLSLGSPALMHFRRRDVKHGPERKTCLSVVLRHGDILVMNGAGVQKYYEHMVEPTSFRIAATARWIDPKRT